jgi:CRISPR system Cascade subunit CasE
MYLSNLRIDLGASGSGPTIGGKWLSNRYRVHQRLCMAFPSEQRLIADPDFLAPFAPKDFPMVREGAEQHRGDAGTEHLAQVHAPRTVRDGFLFRIDPSREGAQIIVQSATVPNWAYAFANFRGVLAAGAQVCEFAPAFTPGQRLQFRLEANPTRKIDTKSTPEGARRHGRRVPVAAAACIDWLRRFEAPGGFAIDPQAVRLECGVARARKSSDAEDGVSYASARFDGVLTVTDPQAFLRKLLAGFGTAKAYGFGLMSVVPAVQ